MVFFIHKICGASSNNIAQENQNNSTLLFNENDMFISKGSNLLVLSKKPCVNTNLFEMNKNINNKDINDQEIINDDDILYGFLKYHNIQNQNELIKKYPNFLNQDQIAAPSINEDQNQIAAPSINEDQNQIAAPQNNENITIQQNILLNNSQNNKK